MHSVAGTKDELLSTTEFTGMYQGNGKRHQVNFISASASLWKWYAKFSKSRLERSRYELETNQSPLAECRGREVDSETREAPQQEEAPATKP